MGRDDPPERDKNGEISRKHGNARVDTLRKIYGQNSVWLIGRCA